MAFTSRDARNALRTLFRRCVECPEASPICGPCPQGQLCVQLSANCEFCARTKCVDSLSVPASGSVTEGNAKGGANVGGIAGGVVGGVVLLTIAVFFIWRYLSKKRNQDTTEEEWQTVEITTEKAAGEFSEQRDARASTHTVASLASTVLTRASNIIQIAYIPGVTNRSGPGSPGLLVPPVPPIPIPTSPSTVAGTPYSTEDQHFFVPGDLRDSTYSGLSDGRSSFARTSIAPSLARSSVATTIYGNNAVISPLPAQTIVRGKAAVVSVKSSQTSSPLQSPGSETPPVPAIDFEKHATKGPVLVQMPRSSDGSARPSPQSSLRSMFAKPVPLNIVKGKVSSSTLNSQKTTSLGSKPRPLTEVSAADSEASDHERARRSEARSVATDSIISDSDSDESDDEHARSRRSLLGSHSNNRDSQVTEIQDTPGLVQSPFLDSPPLGAPEIPSRHPKRQTSNLETVVEESSKPPSRERNASPFSDDHAISGS